MNGIGETRSPVRVRIPLSTRHPPPFLRTVGSCIRRYIRGAGWTPPRAPPLLLQLLLREPRSRRLWGVEKTLLLCTRRVPTTPRHRQTSLHLHAVQKRSAHQLDSGFLVSSCVPKVFLRRVISYPRLSPLPRSSPGAALRLYQQARSLPIRPVSGVTSTSTWRDTMSFAVTPRASSPPGTPATLCSRSTSSRSSTLLTKHLSRCSP